MGILRRRVRRCGRLAFRQTAPYERRTASHQNHERQAEHRPRARHVISCLVREFLIFMKRPKRFSKKAEYWFESGHLHLAEPVGLELLHGTRRRRRCAWEIAPPAPGVNVAEGAQNLLLARLGGFPLVFGALHQLRLVLCEHIAALDEAVGDLFDRREVLVARRVPLVD